MWYFVMQTSDRVDGEGQHTDAQKRYVTVPPRTIAYVNVTWYDATSVTSLLPDG